MVFCALAAHNMAVVYSASTDEADWNELMAGNDTWAYILISLMERATGLETRNAHFIILHDVSDSTARNNVSGAFLDFYTFMEQQGFFQEGDRISYVPFARHVIHTRRATVDFPSSLGSVWIDIPGAFTGVLDGTDMIEPIQTVLEELYATDHKEQELIIIMHFADLVAGEETTGEYRHVHPYFRAPWGIRDLGPDGRDHRFMLGEDGRYRLNDAYWQREDGSFRLDESFMRDPVTGNHMLIGDPRGYSYVVGRYERYDYLLRWFHEDREGIRRFVINTRGEAAPAQWADDISFRLTIWYPDNIIDDFSPPPYPHRFNRMDMLPWSQFSARITDEGILFGLTVDEPIYGMVVYASLDLLSIGNVLRTPDTRLLPTRAVQLNVFREVIMLEHQGQYTFAYHEIPFTQLQNHFGELYGLELIFNVSPIYGQNQVEVPNRGRFRMLNPIEFHYEPPLVPIGVVLITFGIILMALGLLKAQTPIKRTITFPDGSEIMLKRKKIYLHTNAPLNSKKHTKIDLTSKDITISEDFKNKAIAIIRQSYGLPLFSHTVLLKTPSKDIKTNRSSLSDGNNNLRFKKNNSESLLTFNISLDNLALGPGKMKDKRFASRTLLIGIASILAGALFLLL